MGLRYGKKTAEGEPAACHMTTCRASQEKARSWRMTPGIGRSFHRAERESAVDAGSGQDCQHPGAEDNRYREDAEVSLVDAAECHDSQTDTDE